MGTPIFSPQLQHLPTLLPVRSKLQFLDLSMAVIQPQGEETLQISLQYRRSFRVFSCFLFFVKYCLWTSIAYFYHDSLLALLDFSISALEELLSVCFDLKKLSLEHCTLTQAVCSYIAKNTSLETLNLAMCYGLCHSYIVEILTQCKRWELRNSVLSNDNEHLIVDYMLHLICLF